MDTLYAYGEGKANWFVRAELSSMYGGRCAYCGKGPLHDWKITADHVVPRSHGGRTWNDNLLPACRMCNGAKADMTLPEFRQWLAVDARKTYGKHERKMHQRRLFIAARCTVVVDGAPKIRFWFERVPPIKASPVLFALQRIVREERLHG